MSDVASGESDQSGRHLFGTRKSVKTERIALASEINRTHQCQNCDASSVHWGEIREYGVEVFVFGIPIFIPHGENIYCRECRDEIGYKMRDGRVEKP